MISVTGAPTHAPTVAPTTVEPTAQPQAVRHVTHRTLWPSLRPIRSARNGRARSRGGNVRQVTPAPSYFRHVVNWTQPWWNRTESIAEKSEQQVCRASAGHVGAAPGRRVSGKARPSAPPLARPFRRVSAAAVSCSVGDCGHGAATSVASSAWPTGCTSGTSTTPTRTRCAAGRPHTAFCGEPRLPRLTIGAAQLPDMPCECLLGFDAGSRTQWCRTPSTSPSSRARSPCSCPASCRSSTTLPPIRPSPTAGVLSARFRQFCGSFRVKFPCRAGLAGAGVCTPWSALRRRE